MKLNHLITALITVIYLLSPTWASTNEEAFILNRKGLSLAKDGNYQSAIRAFEQACQLDPFNNSALTNLACAHNNVGVILAKKRHYKDAIRHFEAAKAQKPESLDIRLNLLSTLVTLKNASRVMREAKEIVNLRPTDTATILKVAAALQNTENSLEAQTLLEELLDKRPDNYEVLAALGKIHYKNGSLKEAGYLISRAVTLSPDPAPKLKSFLKQINRENEIIKNSKKYNSIHFSLTCNSEFSEETAEKILQILEKSYDKIGEMLNFYPLQRAQVLVLQTSDFKRVHDLPDWAGGVYDGKIRIPVYKASLDEKAVAKAVRHEYTHHVVFLLASGNCPAWLNEGLAQILEFNSTPADLEKKDQKLNKNLKEFNKSIRKSKNRSQVRNIYNQAHNLTLRIIKEGGWSSISAILTKLSLGFSVSEACLEIIGYIPWEN
ncbi:MAG: tetratricopeptide repeat protein [Candidatus Rifleibacteriota bacterium]